MARIKIYWCSLSGVITGESHTLDTIKKIILKQCFALSPRSQRALCSHLGPDPGLSPAPSFLPQFKDIQLRWSVNSILSVDEWVCHPCISSVMGWDAPVSSDPEQGKQQVYKNTNMGERFLSNFRTNMKKKGCCPHHLTKIHPKCKVKIHSNHLVIVKIL